jgi:hypothetical protein
MDLYALDTETMLPGRIIDDYSSLIWTERYASYGEFKLTMPWDAFLARDLINLDFLKISTTPSIMMVESSSIKKQSDGDNLVELSGRSIEAFLQYRSNKTTFGQSDGEALEGTPGEMCDYFVNTYCVEESTAGALNVIPHLVAASGAVGEEQVLTIPRGTIYDMVKSICDQFGLGFRIWSAAILPNSLAFEVYEGFDRTDPDSVQYKEYGPDNETLFNVSTFESIREWKNHARVINDTESEAIDVYLPGTSETVSGFDRRTIVLETENVFAYSLGFLALRDSANKYQLLIDGEVPRELWDSVEYTLGDKVMVKDNFESRMKARVSEIVWTSDETGLARVPTFELTE